MEGVRIPEVEKRKAVPVDTLPKLLIKNYETWGERKFAMRRKNLGIWQGFTWKDVYEKVKYLSLALVGNGFEPGDKLATLGDSDPELFWAELAAQAAGGVMVGIPSQSLPDEVEHQAKHTDTKFIVAQDQEQIDKVAEVKDKLPLLKKVIYWNPKGLANYGDPSLVSLHDFLEQGKQYEKSHPGLFEQMVAGTRSSDPAVIVFTSGTDGSPKAVVLTHDTFLQNARQVLDMERFSHNDDAVSFLLPGWIIEQLLGFGGMLLSGMAMNFPEAVETVKTDLREIGPSVIFSTSRFWENLYSQIQLGISGAGPLKKTVFRLFMPVGYESADLNLEKSKPSLLWRVLDRMAEMVLFRPLRDKHGLVRVRHAYTTGSILSPDVLRLFRAIGVNLKQIYSIAEIGIVAIHRDDDVALESVGTIMPGKEVRISAHGEILVHAAQHFDGYYRQDQDTTASGWFHTGDFGYIRDDGHLVYVDRMSDVRTLASGSKFTPQSIESRLRLSPYIADALVVCGEGACPAAAIINMRFDNVGKWAERQKIHYSTLADLTRSPQVCELLKSEIAKVNTLALADSRIKRFITLSKRFDADDAELTRTGKVRRGFIMERYQRLIAAVFRGDEKITEETPVTYRDGRKGVVKTSCDVITVGD